LKALSTAHDKLLRGRKLVVTYAQQAPMDPGGGVSSYGGVGPKHRKTMTESGRPTTLSMIKSGMGGSRHEGTNDKIAMMEAKLRQMERSQASSGSSLPYHASLPAKPLPSNTPIIQGTQNEPQRTRQRKPPPPLPSLPFAPQPSTEASSMGSKAPTTASGVRALSGSSKSTALIGVKLGKPKEKDKSGQPDAVKPPQAGVV
ncbi:hypothetical protein C8R43DRAFT_870762, partial [Mycena crocata]